MSKFSEFEAKIMLPQDKANHAIYGAVAAQIGQAVALHFGFPVISGAMAGAAIAGGVKEFVIDPIVGGDVSAGDWLATFLGGLMTLPWIQIF